MNIFVQNSVCMKKIIRNILRGCSLTAALFVFEACYGTPPVRDYPIDEGEETTDTKSADEASVEAVASIDVAGEEAAS